MRVAYEDAPAGPEYDATISVQATDGEEVIVSITDADNDYAYINLTPEQAREIGARLYQAAWLADPSKSHHVPMDRW